MTDAAPIDEPNERRKLYRVYGGEPGSRKSVDIYATKASDAVDQGSAWVGVNPDHDTLRVMRIG